MALSFKAFCNGWDCFLLARCFTSNPLLIIRLHISRFLINTWLISLMLPMCCHGCRHLQHRDDKWALFPRCIVQGLHDRVLPDSRLLIHSIACNTPHDTHSPQTCHYICHRCPARQIARANPLTTIAVPSLICSRVEHALYRPLEGTSQHSPSQLTGPSDS